MGAPCAPALLASPDHPTLVLHDELITDYVLDTDLVVDGPRKRLTTVLAAESVPVASDIRPALIVGTRVYMDDEGAVRLCPPLGEPALECRPGCIIVRRTRREVAVAGDVRLLWALLQVMDGVRTTAALLAELPEGHHITAARLLANLAAAGVVDVSGRPIGRFLHAATKKGVLPGGGLDIGDVLRLVTDGNYRTYPHAARVSMRDEVPKPLTSLHTIIRARRSHRDYNGAAISRPAFEALLNTAGGVTGTMEWAGRTVELRAYPSSGGLYTVEIYPVVFAVDGLATAVYHYRASENALEVVRPGIDRTPFLNAALPEERGMLGAVAAMICLAGRFARHERKYGEGGYRMIVAEAGHISQNLILTATALGLYARPFGGVFDDLLNRALGFDSDGEQFLLSVIVGCVGDKP